MATGEPTDSPFQPRTLTRDTGSSDLTAYARRVEQENRLFAEAVEARQKALLCASPLALKTTLKERRQRLVDEQARSASPDSPLRTQDSKNRQAINLSHYHDITRTKPTSQSSDIAVRGSAASEQARLAKAGYARRMAESTLTRNGRALMGESTTMTSTWHVVWHNSAYTRPLGEMLREVLEVRYPPGPRKEREGELEGLLAEEGSGEG
ncbi:hypothetical protein LTR08_008894 [Meristemomyces frigidus]|nr:hypothetical protein LTR08_008894 [Meristemomyces frigidus]